jgi:hypothetical protein
MKKISLLKSLLFASSLFSTIAGVAQSDVSFASVNSSKKPIVEIATGTTLPVIKETTLASFHSSFPDAKNVAWFDMDNGVLYVVFNTPGKANRAVFDKKGKLIYSLSYYFKEMLPLSVLQNVKANFCGKSIFGVTEIRKDHETVYEIVLEDETSWTHIKIAGDEITKENVWRKVQP